MKSALCLVLLCLTVDFLKANPINWDALNADPILVIGRPAPLKRPVPPARPAPPIEDEYLPPTLNESNGWGSEMNGVNVNVQAVGDGASPPNIGPVEKRPFEPRPTPPNFEQPMGPPGPAGPPGPQSTQHPQPLPEPNNNKPKPPHHFEIQVNEPLDSHHNKMEIDVKPYDVVDGVIIPKPKYPAHSRPQIEVFYEK